METVIQMVCFECGVPLNCTETWADGDLASLEYHHPLRAEGDWDHPAQPALADTAKVVGGCDCCGIPAPRAEGFVNTWVIDPARPVTLAVGDRVYDYSSPWSVCAACSAAIADDDLKLLLWRSAEHGRRPEWVGEEEHEAGRALARDLLLAFLTARPRHRGF